MCILLFRYLYIYDIIIVVVLSLVLTIYVLCPMTNTDFPRNELIYVDWTDSSLNNHIQPSWLLVQTTFQQDNFKGPEISASHLCTCLHSLSHLYLSNIVDWIHAKRKPDWHQTMKLATFTKKDCLHFATSWLYIKLFNKFQPLEFVESNICRYKSMSCVAN